MSGIVNFRSSFPHVRPLTVVVDGSIDSGMLNLCVVTVAKHRKPSSKRLSYESRLKSPIWTYVVSDADGTSCLTKTREMSRADILAKSRRNPPRVDELGRLLSTVADMVKATLCVI